MANHSRGPMKCSTGRVNRPFLWGTAGALGLLAFYALLLSILNSPEHAWSEFVRMWYWILLLAAGFGIQMGLYGYIREHHRGTGAAAASGGISAGAMAACCAHHLAEVLPLLGLAAASAFLLKYQLWFIIAGIASNILGIAYMLHCIRRMKMKKSRKFSTERAITIGLWGVIGIGLLFAALMIYQVQAADAAPVSRGAPGSNIIIGTTEQGDVAVDLTPKGVVDGHLVFDIGINTHSVDLNAYDLTQIATLEYNGKSVKADAAPQLGGHHVYGTLAFPVQGTPTSFTVRITGIPRQERVFAW